MTDFTDVNLGEVDVGIAVQMMFRINRLIIYAVSCATSGRLFRHESPRPAKLHRVALTEFDHAKRYQGQGCDPRNGLFSVRRALGGRCGGIDGRAFAEAIDAGIDQSDRRCMVFDTLRRDQRRQGGLPLSIALRLPNIAVTRVENFCASGSEAFRGAVYAVSGACDTHPPSASKNSRTRVMADYRETSAALAPQWSANGSAPGNSRNSRVRIAPNIGSIAKT